MAAAQILETQQHLTAICCSLHGVVRFLCCLLRYTKTDCIDSHDSCGNWKERGECHTTPYYMLFSCKKSCLPKCQTPKACPPSLCLRALSGGGISISISLAFVVAQAPNARRKPGYSTDVGTRAFATAGPAPNVADGHFRRDPSMGEFYAPGALPY